MEESYDLTCPYCNGEFPLDLDCPETGESECPICMKEIVIEWETFPDETEMYWVNTPEDSKKYWGSDNG